MSETVLSSVLPAVLVFLPFAGGLAGYLIGRRNETARDYFADLLGGAEFLLALGLLLYYRGSAGAVVMRCDLPEVCGFGLHFMEDGFRLLYGTVASFMWMMALIFSREYLGRHENRNRYYAFMLFTLGATMGVFLSADLFTTFIFFEIMSLTSYVWVAQEETGEALKAASTYLAVAVIGGLAMLMGLFLLYHTFGTLSIASLAEQAAHCENRRLLYAAGVCMLVGFGAKAGAFPLHIWLPKAHPVAPAPASALLSGILTKTGVFGILLLGANLFLRDARWGTLILIIGVLTMFTGAMLAVFSVDLKRTLACSSMSQIGFILVGIGMQGLLGAESALAVHGTLLHMLNHSLIKLVLFMAAGAIYMNAHALDLNGIRGFGRKKPLLNGIFLIGALSIAGFPLFSGYISKTLLHESIVEYGSGPMRLVEALFLLSGGLTAAYMTKLYVAIFIEKNEDEALQSRYDSMHRYMNKESRFALGVSAALLLILGLFPHGLMDRAAAFGQSLMRFSGEAHTVRYFSLENLKGALISLGIGALVYGLIIRRLLVKRNTEGERRYIDVWPKWLDLEDLIYRPLLLRLLPLLCAVVCRIFDSLIDLVVVLLRKTVYKDSPLPAEPFEGTVVTETGGRLLNRLQRLFDIARRKKQRTVRDYRHILAMKHLFIKESNTILERSLSFGLLLFCIGLCAVLLYILLW